MIEDCEAICHYTICLMHPIDPKDTLFAFPGIIIHFVEHRYECQLWTWGSGTNTKKEGIASSSGPGKKEGNHGTSQIKRLHSAFHVLESYTTESVLESNRIR